MGDFLQRAAETPLSGFYLAAGAYCRLTTNSPALLEIAREAFLEVNPSPSVVDFELRFWVDPDAVSQPPWPKPYLRGLDHLIFAGYDAQSSFLVDRRARRAIGRIPPAMAADGGYWKSVIFPNLLTLLGPVIGVMGLHCSCVVRDRRGLLLWGGQGSGKSTLTMALARSGFSFLSDDWTYFSMRHQQLLAWGLINKLKLLPDAGRFFPELAKFRPGVSTNGETAYEAEPEAQLGLPRSRSCEPRWLMLLERQARPEFTISRISPREAASRLQWDLLAETEELLQPQLAMIENLTQRGSWLLRCGGPPAEIAQKLADFCGAE